MRVYVTIGPCREHSYTQLTRCEHGKGHMNGYQPAVWVLWGSGDWTSPATTPCREFMCLCVSCALRAATVYPEFQVMLHNAMRMAVADNVHAHAVRASGESAHRTIQILSNRDAPVRSDVAGAVQRLQYHFDLARHQLENPEEYVKWTTQQLLDALHAIDGWILTGCERCSIMWGTGGHEMSSGQEATPTASASLIDFTVEQAEQLEDTRDQLQQVRNLIATAIERGDSPDQVGALQEQANELVSKVVALESQVTTPRETTSVEKGGTMANDKDKPKAPRPARERKPAPAPRQPELCWCGCGGLAGVGRRFIPGHDSKFKSMLKRIERGDAKLSDQPKRFQEIAQTLPKCTVCSNPIWGGVEKNEAKGIVGVAGGPGAANAVGPECAKKAKAKAEADAKPKPAPVG